MFRPWPKFPVRPRLPSPPPGASSGDGFPDWLQRRLTSTPAAGGGTQWSLSIQTLLLLTSLSFLPAMVLMMTSFTRIIIVFSLLRHAWAHRPRRPTRCWSGSPCSSPSSSWRRWPTHLHRGLSALSETASASRSARQGRRAAQARLHAQAGARARPRHSSPSSPSTPPVGKADDLPMRVVIPAFVTSELKTAFQIGFIVFIPFLIIDMVVASVLMSMGMMMMSPVIVSLPFKIMLFVLVDGWNLLIGSLVQSFG
jgi:flagellar biosynthetic protein FliP